MSTPEPVVAPVKVDQDLHRSLRLPARPLLRAERASSELQVQVRIAAAGAAALMYKGGFLRGEVDMEELLSCATDIEDWINRT